MSWVARLPGIGNVYRAVISAARGVWTRDRASLRGLRAIGNRLFRIAGIVVRGVIAHRLGLLAAALTYFTVFAIVPLLVVVLWALKLLDHLPLITAQIPAAPANNPSGNQLFQAALGQILTSVHQASEFPGVIGLLALLLVIGKMFSYTERALHIIAASTQRTPNFSRVLCYVALLVMPPALLGILGLLLLGVQRSVGGQLAHLLGILPGLRLLLGAIVGFTVLWLAVTLFYSSGVRARIPFRSAAVGGALAALALPIIFWLFANLQMGVSQTGSLSSGFLAFPVFLLWAYSSWFALLVGAEIAVAEHLDRVLIHGARAFHLDLVGERQASAAIMIQMTRRARAHGGARTTVSEDDLARELRLPPNLVGDLCLRLVDRGLLSEDRHGFSLSRDPDRTALAAVIAAVERDPALEEVHREAESSFDPRARAALAQLAGARAATGGPTLGELADERSGVEP